MKKSTLLTCSLLLLPFLASASLTRLVPEHGISKAFSLKTDSQVEYIVRFYRPDVFRVEAAPKIWTGEGTNRTCKLDFSDHVNDPNRAQMLVDGYREDTTLVKFADQDGKFVFTTTEIIVEFDKAREVMSVWNWDRSRTGESDPILAEVAPLAFSSNKCVQTLLCTGDTRYYGGGQQLGRLMHKGAKIAIDCDYNWADGGAPNPVPFVLSSDGYGVFRHTFAPGEYDFTANDTCSLSHDEERFDAFYFIGDFATVIDRYTEMTGRPNLLPMWGLELGDADAYMTRDNDTKHPRQHPDGVFVETTPDVLKIAQSYREANMPGAWILVNDGYGCGYTMLGGVVWSLAQYGFKTGLWTEGALDRIAWEVGTAGTRVQKLDVAWTSQGEDYKMQHALQCNKDAFLGMTTNSESRAFIWSVLGWAGSQRYGISWAGDQYGGWDLIRYMIPGVTGSAMSGQAYATADIDGIFGGSDETYLRDLQWKCWTTAMYVMNGWSHKNKSPFSYAEPYRSLIRRALMEKIRYTPYVYAAMRESWEHGTPIVRPMVWNSPEDGECWGEKVKYQFMLGDDILVAPVYTSMKVNKGWWRKGIYLPRGDWYDLNDGRRVKGSRWLGAYPIDLTKIPVFVRAGAIIPKYDAALSTMSLDKSRITFDVWPGSQDDEFVTYEDDGDTRSYEGGSFERYRVRQSGAATPMTMADLTVTIDPVVEGGERYAGFRYWNGRPEKRVFAFDIHLQSKVKPAAIVMGGREIAELVTTNAIATLYENSAQGWYYDANEKFGTLHLKLLPRNLENGERLCFTVRMPSMSVARVASPDYPQPTAEEEAESAVALVKPAVEFLKNKSLVDGGDIVVAAGGPTVTIGPMDGTFTRITGHVATHRDNKPSARFTFTITADDEKIFERANMKGGDVPQLIAVDIPSGKHWIKFDFKADDDSAESKSAKGVWKDLKFVAE